MYRFGLQAFCLALSSRLLTYPRGQLPRTSTRPWIPIRTQHSLLRLECFGSSTV
ncbi:hypothetical protein SCLCIDRAFT_1219447 [Scleroderma citrinum Foug A]|uniref:Uncharacterized protein n=1 Tax=Scleroderma citrinum Foug A TaxID=1036808 RepID=A0A0C3DMC3_9AGAM|nr:hypothetical protein SCLCIDRAFT_1219447 [Scleroderma citrinum Foug A]